MLCAWHPVFTEPAVTSYLWWDQLFSVQSDAYWDFVRTINIDDISIFQFINQEQGRPQAKNVPFSKYVNKVIGRISVLSNIATIKWTTLFWTAIMPAVWKTIEKMFSRASVSNNGYFEMVA